MENQINTAPVQSTATVHAPIAAAQTTTNTVAPQAAKVEHTGMVNLEIGVANMETISTNPNEVLPKLVNSNDVNFKVQYSKDYKGEKLMPEGNMILSKESAAHFEQIGIGKIVK